MSETILAVKAKSASSFTSAIGVNVHLSYYNTIYANTATVIADLQYLGIDQVRDAAPITADQDYWVQFEQAMAAGIKFDLVIPSNVLNVQTDISVLDALKAAKPGGIQAVEGVNEGNSTTTVFDGLTGASAVNAFQIQLAAAIRADSRMAGTKIYNYTMNSYDPADYKQFGDTSAESDYANAHVYFGYYAPSVIIPQLLSLELAGGQNEPFVVTETGYDTMPGQDSDGSQGVDADVQAKYTLDNIFDLIKAGASKIYLYELLDEMADPNMQDHEQHFGLYNNDGTPKEAAVALHDLTAILADPNATESFTPGSLAYGIAGLPSTGNTMLLGKSNGSFDLAIWAEPEIWNPTTLREIAAPASPVAITLGQMAGSVEVYDPLLGTAPIAQYSGVSQVTIEVTDHPLIIEIHPLTAPMVNAVPTMQIASGTIAPFSTLTIADAAQQDTATVALSATTHGTFGNLGIGAYSAQTGIYTVSGTPTQVAAALGALTFTPAGGSITGLVVTVTNSSGSAGLTTTVKDPFVLAKPALAGVPATQAASVSVTPFATLQLTDAAGLDGASIVLSTPSEGTFGNLGTGRYSTATGVYNVSGTPAQVATALQHLTFMPIGGSSLAYTTTLTLTVSNQVGTNSVVTSVLGRQKLPAPILSGIPATQTASGAIAPFGALQLADLTMAEGASIVVSAPLAGSLTNLGCGSYSPVSGIYSVTGTPAQVATSLQQLIFTPAPGNSLLTTVRFSLSITNMVGTSSATTSVVEVNQALLPIPPGEAPATTLWSPTSAGAPSPIAGAFNEAVVAAAAGKIVAPSGFQAVLLGGTGAAQLVDTMQGGIVLGADQGTVTLQASVPGDTLIGSTGADTFLVSGGDTVTAGTGTTTITATGVNQLHLGAGTAMVRSAGGDTIYAGAGSATITAGTGDTVHLGSGTLTFLGGTGTTTLKGANGAIMITSANGVVVSANATSINAASGSFSKLVLADSAGHTVTGGSRGETIDASASTGANTLIAGSGADRIIGGTGKTVIVAGRGGDTMSSAGPTQFAFTNGSVAGTDFIAGFNPAQDTIVLAGYAANMIASVVQSAHVSGGSTLMLLPDGTQLGLTGVTGVKANWFATALH